MEKPEKFEEVYLRVRLSDYEGHPLAEIISDMNSMLPPLPEIGPLTAADIVVAETPYWDSELPELDASFAYKTENEEYEQQMKKYEAWRQKHKSTELTRAKKRLAALETERQRLLSILGDEKNESDAGV